MSIKYYGKPDNFVDPSLVMEGMAQIASFLPAGGLRDFLSNPLGTVTNLLKGKVFQSGQYILGERFIRHILQKQIQGRGDVPDEAVPSAQMFFTGALGVDVNNDEDLQALDSSVDSYFLRPDKSNIPRAAVERAVEIKKFWPMSKNGAWYIPWPLEPIYDIKTNPTTMSYYSNLIKKQMPILLKSETGESNVDDGTTSTITESLKKPKTWILILIAVAIIVGGYFLLKHKK